MGRDCASPKKNPRHGGGGGEKSQVDMENLSHYSTIRILISPKGFSHSF